MHDLLGKEQEPDRNDDIEQKVEIDGDLSVVEGCRREQLFDVGQQRHYDGAADQAEQEIAQRHASRFGRRSHGIEHREQAASEIGAQHQAQCDMQGNHLWHLIPTTIRASLTTIYDLTRVTRRNATSSFLHYFLVR